MSDRDDEIMRTLGRIEGKVSALDGVPERLRKVENSQSRMTGIGVVLGAIGTAGLSLFSSEYWS
jgi:hypothetical protein